MYFHLLTFSHWPCLLRLCCNFEKSYRLPIGACSSAQRQDARGWSNSVVLQVAWTVPCTKPEQWIWHEDGTSNLAGCLCFYIYSWLCVSGMEVWYSQAPKNMLLKNCSVGISTFKKTNMPGWKFEDSSRFGKTLIVLGIWVQNLRTALPSLQLIKHRKNVKRQQLWIHGLRCLFVHSITFQPLFTFFVFVFVMAWLCLALSHTTLSWCIAHFWLLYIIQSNGLCRHRG